MDARYRAVLDLPKPRNVRLSKRGRFWLWLLLLAVCAVETGMIATLSVNWARLQSLPELIRLHGIAFYGVFVVPALPFVYHRTLLRQRKLLASGEIAIATITERIHDLRMKAYYVEYRFSLSNGDVAEGKCLDATELLHQGSTMLVYYDASNLDDKIAQCEAYYEVQVPGFAEDYVDAVG